MYRIVAIWCERDASQADAAVPLIIVARMLRADVDMPFIVDTICREQISQADVAMPLYS